MPLTRATLWPAAVHEDHAARGTQKLRLALQPGAQRRWRKGVYLQVDGGQQAPRHVLLVAPVSERDVQIYSAPGRSLAPAATGFVAVLTQQARSPGAVPVSG